MNFPKPLDVRESVELTPEQEIEILQSLSPEQYLGCGSSRAVYSLNDEYVVKIAIAIPGVNQNKTELDRYLNENAINRSHPEDREVTAIAAYGLCILVAEKVNTDFGSIGDTYSIDRVLHLLNEEPSMYDEDSLNKQLQYHIKVALKLIGVEGNTREEFYKHLNELEKYQEMVNERVDEAERVEEYLNGEYGCTEDNKQVGMTTSGRIVAYDYGYQPDDDHMDQVSHIGDMMDYGLDVILQAIDNIKLNNIPSDEELDELCGIGQEDEDYEEDDEDYEEDDSEECGSDSAEDVKVYDIEGRIDNLIVDVYNQLASHPDKPVSIEDIVTTIDRWGESDGADYWKELLGLDVRNWSPDNDRDFKNACNYVREFSYHTDKLGQIEYEKNISEE